MGSHLFCGTKCQQCVSACPQDRCSCACLPEKQRLFVQSFLHTTIEMPARPPEKYDIVGASDNGGESACALFGGVHPMMYAVGQEDPQHDIAPAPAPLILNVGHRSSLQSLEDDCKFNESKLSKIRSLATEYSHWRPIRGDGNCYYRAVAFGTLEAALLAACRDSDAPGGRLSLLQQVADVLAQVSYEEAVEQEAHEELLQFLQTWTGLRHMVQQVAENTRLDLALVRACRRLVRMFLVSRAAEASPSGLTYSELCCALDAACTGVEDFCSRAVDPMGNEAETLALDALPQQLGIGQRVWLVDRREEVDLTHQDLPNSHGTFDVHLLFKPGHYDLLYKSDEKCACGEDPKLVVGCEHMGQAISSLSSGCQSGVVAAASA